jgi:CubicO group peptidase (beta-lactamase class C family)
MTDGKLPQELDAAMRLLYPADLPGAALLVRQHGCCMLEKAYGLAALAAGRPVTAATNFRMASLTKQFTACSILLLLRQGLLSLADPVRRYLPSLPSALESITVRHLLSHTSGIRAYESLIAPSCRTQLKDADVLRLLQSKNETCFPAGQRFRYSNTGYCLLSLIVEKVSGLSFGAFLKKRIFDPLEMKDARLYEKGLAVAHRAFGYRRQGSGYLEADQDLTSATSGDGGIYLSLKDYLKWHEALENDVLLPEVDMAAAYSPQTAIKDGISYGYGWFTGKDTDGSICRFHSGESTGFRHVVYFNREKDLLVVLFSNREDTAMEAFGKVSRLMHLSIAGIEGNLMGWMEGVYRG